MRVGSEPGECCAVTVEPERLRLHFLIVVHLVEGEEVGERGEREGGRGKVGRQPRLSSLAGQTLESVLRD